MLCSELECPGGFVCGKSNDNPNYGSTSFDNVFYSFLIVFQSVTLEGWSDIQRQMQIAYSIYIPLYFLPLVFIGAFFFLNLTLAVINSKFTEAHSEQQKLEQSAIGVDPSDQGLPDNDQAKEQLSLQQYTLGRKYSKKMIEFLRMRQRSRWQHDRRWEQSPQVQKVLLQKKSERIPHHLQRKASIKIVSKQDVINEQQRIREALAQTMKGPSQSVSEDASQASRSNLDKDIQEFLATNNFKLMWIKHNQRNNPLPYSLENSRVESSNHIKMKGIIDKQKKMDLSLHLEADSLDIDTLIPNKDQLLYEEAKENTSGLKLDDSELGLMGRKKERNGDEVKVPGFDPHGDDTDLITSDSNFELQSDSFSAKDNYLAVVDSARQIRRKRRQKDVSNKFKQMLSTQTLPRVPKCTDHDRNHHLLNEQASNTTADHEKIFIQELMREFNHQRNSKLEQKFRKRARKPLIKIYDEDVEERECIKDVQRFKRESALLKKTKKKDIREL